MPKFDIYIKENEDDMYATYYTTIECATEDEANNIAESIQNEEK